MLIFNLLNFLLAEMDMTENTPPHIHGSWFGVGDGTVIMWPLVWTLLPIGLFAIISLIWAAKTGQFRDVEKIAERQLELED